MKKEVMAVAMGALAPAAFAGVSNYDDLPESFLGTSYSYNGVNYHTVNNVAGVFPDGSTFTAADGGDQLIIAHHDTVVEAEDHVILFTLPENIAAIEEVFSGRESFQVD